MVLRCAERWNSEGRLALRRDKGGGPTGMRGPEVGVRGMQTTIRRLGMRVFGPVLGDPILARELPRPRGRDGTTPWATARQWGAAAGVVGGSKGCGPEWSHRWIA